LRRRVDVAHRERAALHAFERAQRRERQAHDPFERSRRGDLCERVVRVLDQELTADRKAPC
jgi:hypothetical protein